MFFASDHTLRVSNINREILNQTYQELDQAILSKFPKIGEWLDGSLSPTIKQLADYAKIINIPFGYFFFGGNAYSRTFYPPLSDS